MKLSHENLQELSIKQGLKLLEEWQLQAENLATQLDEIDENIKRLRKIIRGKRK